MDNVPELRFSKFSGNWEENKLGDITKIQRGRFSPRPRNDPRYYGGNIPFIQTSDVVNSRGLIDSFSQTLNEEGLKVSKLFPKGTILITIAANIGYAGVLQEDMACPDSLIGLSCNKYSFNYFLNYILEIHQPKMDYLATAAAQKNINVEFLKPYKITIPSLPEQQKIATFLSAVDKKLGHLRRKYELLESYKRGIMQKIFSQELRFKQDNGADFPDWKEKYGGDIFESISNKKHNSDLPILAITQDLGAIPRDLINYKMTVSESSISSYKIVEIGDFIISLRSFQGGIEYSQYKGICSPAYIILKPTIEIDSMFYKYYFKTFGYIQELTRKLEGIRDGKMISYKYFSEIKIPYPSIPEQQKITSFLSTLEKKLEAVQKQIDQTESFKKGLLQKMFV